MNVLRLGSVSQINLEALTTFDLILTSSQDLNLYLKRFNLNTVFVPMYTTYAGKKAGKCAVNSDDDCYWILLGNLDKVEDYLIKNKLKYKKYNTLSSNEVDNIYNNFDNINGVITSRSRLSNFSLDVHPIFLELIARKIPIFTESLWNGRKTENSDSFALLFFSDALSYYTYSKDIDYFFNNPKYRSQKADYSLEYLINFLSVDYVSDKILNILGLEAKMDKAQKVVSIFSPTFTGLYNNGDYWIAKDIEAELKKFNYKTLVYFPTSQISNIGDIDIYIRGGLPLKKRFLDQNKSSIAYILFPFFENETDFNINTFSLDDYIKSIKEELLRYDAVAVASKKMFNTLRKQNINAYYVPQFTNTSKFYPDFDESLKSEILFVGNNTFYRKAPKVVVENNLPITIYGDNWDGLAKAKYIDNQILRKYYSSAKIVLNDTREAMKHFGFIINRIFDVTACNGFIISDYVKEVEDIYGDSIPMYKNDEELISLLKYYLDPKNENERLEKIKRANEITLKYFTSDAAVKTFIDIDRDIRKNKKLDN